MGRIPYSGDLLAGGVALKRWFEITRESPLRMTPSMSQEMHECAVRHLVRSQRAAISFVPKHHMFAHLSVRSYEHGNPKLYSTFKDESLNLVLRTAAAFAHRAHQVAITLSSINMQGGMGWSSYLFGACQTDDDP